MSNVKGDLVITRDLTVGRDSNLMFKNLPATYREIHCSPEGNDTTGDGTLGRPFLTINKAISIIVAPFNADTQWIIRLAQGQYVETADIVIPPYTHLIGESYRSTYVRVNGGTNTVRPSADWGTYNSVTSFKDIYIGANTSFVFDLATIGSTGSVISLENMWFNSALNITGGVSAIDTLECNNVFFYDQVNFIDMIAQVTNCLFLSTITTTNSTLFSIHTFINCNFTFPVTFDCAASAGEFRVTSSTFTDFGVGLTTIGDANLNIDSQSLPKIAQRSLSANTILTFYNNTTSLEHIPSDSTKWFGSPASMLTSDAINQLKDHWTDLGNPHGWVNHTDTSLTFTNATRTFTLNRVNDYEYYINSVRYLGTASKSVQITDTEGLWYFYIDTSGTLQTTQVITGLLYGAVCLTAIAYWSVPAQAFIYTANERHTTDWLKNVWIYTHLTRGTQFLSGLALGNFTVDGTGNVNTDATFSCTDGEIADENIRIPITNNTPQQLSTIARIPMYYRTGVSSWRKTTADDYACINYLNATDPSPRDGTTRLAYNENIAGNWQLTQLGTGDYVLTHIYATNDINTPMIGILGQAEYGSVADARTGANVEINSLITSGLPFVEFKPIGTVIYQTQLSYTNLVNARIRSTGTGSNYVDWRFTALSSTANASSHANLTELTLDSHPQYALLAGRTGDILNVDQIQPTSGKATPGIDLVGVNFSNRVGYSSITTTLATHTVTSLHPIIIIDNSITTIVNLPSLATVSPDSARQIQYQFILSNLTSKVTINANGSDRFYSSLGNSSLKLFHDGMTVTLIGLSTGFWVIA